MPFLPAFGLTRERQDVHAVYVPESRCNFAAEAERLRKIMDKNDCVNIFVSEGACVKEILKEMKKRGETVPVDAFGHPRLDKVNVGQYFAKRFGELLGAEQGRRVRARRHRRCRRQGRRQPQRPSGLRVRAHQGRQALQCAQFALPQAAPPDRAAHPPQNACRQEVEVTVVTIQRKDSLHG